MKKILTTTLLLGMIASAQQTGQPQPPAQSQPPASGGQQPAPQGAAQPATPAAPDKSRPMAKSQEEFTAYQAVANNADAKAGLAAADDFAKKYPDSELRVPLYINVMNKFYNANDADNTLEAADRILAIEPDHTMALVISSGVLAERTRETDLDRDERLAKAVERANKAISTIDTGLVVPPNVTPEQRAGLKQMLVSMAKANLGYVELAKKNYPGAEKHLAEAVEVGKAKPDGTTYYRLALAQHGQKKFGEALKNANKAVELAQAENNPALLQLAQEEKTKLEKAK